MATGTTPFTMIVPAVLGPSNLLEPKIFGAKQGRAPAPGDKEAAPKYNAQLVFEPDAADLIDLARVIVGVAKEANPGEDIEDEIDCLREVITSGKYAEADFTWPIKSGTEMAERRLKYLRRENGGVIPEGQEKDDRRGKVVVLASSKYPVGLSIIGPKGNPVDLEGLAITQNKALFTPGRLVCAQFAFRWHDAVGRNPAGVMAFLQLVLATGDKVAFAVGSNTRSATLIFKNVTGRPSMVDPLRGREPQARRVQKDDDMSDLVGGKISL